MKMTKQYLVSPATMIMTNDKSGEEISRTNGHVIGNIFGEYMETKTEEETVTITKREYVRLLKAEAHLDFLIERGVDNWSGYGVPSDDDDEEDE